MKMDISKKVLGIIVCYGKTEKMPPFSEAPFFSQLAVEGESLGIEVCVFNPQLVHWKTRTVPCWIVENGRWKMAVKPLPSLIYDRCYYHTTEHYLRYKPYVLKLANDPHIRLLGRALGGKWQTYEILKQHKEIAPYLPHTIFYRSSHDVLAFLQNQPSALIKPNGGSHGRGVVAITKHPPGYLIQGRTQANKLFYRQLKTVQELETWIQNFIGRTRYIIQPLLPLMTPDQRPFDVRILVQKNEERNWETTGMAVRTGKPNSITSNLHGGGQAVAFRPFLQKHYAQETIFKIQETIQFLSSIVPRFIEQQHGPLVELGIDVGIEPSGRIWILEVNSKPGRAVFLRTGEINIRRRAVQLPIRYAHSLLKNT
ncbi:MULTISPECIES: YheC/YheD family protein [Thermoactinomyces]|jgi:glutathione synthase/RimK-type ligase-like ATP-grasp enzyme|uniref:YheC/YheD family protein n=1 Tax=Thermoactinomyces daqus TaxID=1329516 RepID=A0A7W1X7R4_9BACL|nr:MULTISPECIES: YheC/YheD family protein [Thermoactinomyces]MBA4541610.1 YheC/YheD family protein [Thermoactinomyces daqus]MBH8597606.1 YheC/YheD family protein [Thermoactinomyces sp. CICC 10523]MBH8603947.1 YheC/YheD family protein [Thermoactinomyces sp. CICC 10522]MBH8606519.1 YheC/YheD family protein [Thermoactinomyces sp. CICC 10521]